MCLRNALVVLFALTVYAGRDANLDECGCNLLDRPFPELDRLTGPAKETGDSFEWCALQRAVVLNHDPTGFLALADRSLDWMQFSSSCPLGTMYIAACKLVQGLLNRQILTQTALLEDSQMTLVNTFWGSHSLHAILASFWADSITKMVVLSKAFTKQPSQCPHAEMVDRLATHIIEGGGIIMTSEIDRMIYDMIPDTRCNIEYTMLLMVKIRADGKGDFSSLSFQINLHEAFYSAQHFFELLDCIRFYDTVQVPLTPTLDWLITQPEQLSLYSNQYMTIQVFPFREMASEYVRVLKQPLCTTAPFRRMIPKLASAIGDGDTQHFNIVEVGPNLGDCGLWAASLLRINGKSATTVFIEALPEAADQISASVKFNNISAVVYPRAFGANSTASMKLSYLPGRAAQASNIATLPDCVTHKHICSFVDIPTIALDDIVSEQPNLTPIHILKIYAYGEELNGLRGSQRLLGQGEICLIYLHGFNLKKGVKNEEGYAEKLWDLLTGYKLLHYPSFNPRSPSYVRLQKVEDLKDIFVTQRDIVDDFLLAVAESQQCADFTESLDFL